MKSTVNYIVSLSTLFVLVFARDECPPAVLIAPCICHSTIFFKQVICSNITSVSTLQAMFEKTGDYPITFFVLEYSNLMYIPAAAVVKKKFEWLIIRHSMLTSLFDVAPTIDSNLIIIQLIDVKFQRGIQWDLMANLGKLLHIIIESSESRKLGKNFTDNVTAHLKGFSLEDTKTSSLDDNVFARMKEIERIDIRKNNLSTLKRSLFANPSTYLESIDFSHNQIETLPDDLFQGMPRLSMIHLDDNRLKYISESVFGGHSHAVPLSIFAQANPIICDCSIRWYVKDKRYHCIYASCKDPEDKRNRDVSKLQPADFNYCSNTLFDAIKGRGAIKGGSSNCPSGGGKPVALLLSHKFGLMRAKKKLLGIRTCSLKNK